MYEDIIKSSKWSESHGADGSFAGMGTLYYALPYALEAKVCVCLGSGAGFVPKLMCEAQRVLCHEGRLSQIDVTLVDASSGIWGSPVYENEIEGYPGTLFLNSFFRRRISSNVSFSSL